MAKKNYKKLLPKAGSTMAVALAMTVALSTQVSATELDESELPLDNNLPEEGTQTDTTLNIDGMEPAEANQAIDEANKETIEENQETIENNEQTDLENDDAAEKNEELTGGKLENPDLELPEAPEAPNTEGMGTEEHNEEIGEYNEKIDEYNTAIGEHNDKVDEYNGKAEEIEKKDEQRFENEQEAYNEEEKQHEEADKKHQEDLEKQKQDAAAYEQYLKDKEAYDKANADYLEALGKYEASLNENTADAAAREQYLKDKEAYDKAHADYLEALGQYENTLSTPDAGSESYQQYLQDKAAYDEACANYLAAMEKYNNETLPEYEKDSESYQQYLKDKAAYDKAYADYLEALYQYNNGELSDYADRLEQSETEKEILEDVNKYNDEVKEKNEQIANDNAALEDNIDVGVVESLKDVGTINGKVEIDAGTLGTLGNFENLAKEQKALKEAGKALATHAGKGAELGSDAYAAYLAAVEAHNDAVDAFNAKVAAYNEAVEKYNDAVDAFNTTQTGSSSSTTDGAASNGTADWGNYADDNLFFNHLDVRYDAADVKDKIVDEEGNVTGYSDVTSKYDVEGVYYDETAAKNNPDKYGINYTDTDGNGVKYEMVKDDQHDEFGTASKKNGQIDRTDAEANKNTVVTFYATLDDGSGEMKDISVRLDANSVYAENSYVKVDSGDYLHLYEDSNGEGLQLVKIGEEWYYDVSGKPVYLISALVCDGYNPYGYFNMGGLDLILNMQTMIEIHQADSAKKVGFMSYELEKYKAVDENSLSNPGGAPTAPTFNLGDVTHVSDPGKRPDAPTYDPGVFDKEKPKEAIKLDRLEKAATLDGLNEKLVILFDDPVAPPEIAPANDNFVVDFEITIPDEAVPLAAAPETGDISGLWAILSGFSAAGMALLGRKRKEEE